MRPKAQKQSLSLFHISRRFFPKKGQVPIIFLFSINVLEKITTLPVVLRLPVHLLYSMVGLKVIYLPFLSHSTTEYKKPKITSKTYLEL